MVPVRHVPVVSRQIFLYRHLPHSAADEGQARAAEHKPQRADKAEPRVLRHHLQVSVPVALLGCRALAERLGRSKLGEAERKAVMPKAEAARTRAAEVERLAQMLCWCLPVMEACTRSQSPTDMKRRPSRTSCLRVMRVLTAS